MIWGRPTWGVYWVWDARLTSTARACSCCCSATKPCGAPRSTRSCEASEPAIVGLLLLPNVVIVNRSVEWWRSLHQAPTLLRLDPTIEGLQLFTLVFAMGVVGLDVRVVLGAPVPSRLARRTRSIAAGSSTPSTNGAREVAA